MALDSIPINQGVYRLQNNRALLNSPYAENLINYFIDQAGTNYDRPRLASLAELTSRSVIGIYYFDNAFICVTADRNIFKVTSFGTVTNITGVALPGIARPVFTDTGSLLIITGGSTPIKWSGGATVTAALGGSPPSMTHIEYLDGYLIGNVAGTKTIQFCDFDTPETWTGTNVFSANAAPDVLTGIAVSQRELYAIGEETTEVWQNVGSSPIPFERTFVWQHGTRTPYAIHSVDNSVFIIDQNKRILRIEGRQISNIGEPIEKEISAYASINGAFSGSFEWNGSIHVMFGFPDVGKLWSVDLRNKQWSEWLGYDSGWTRCRTHALFYSVEEKIILAGDPTSGDLWKFSNDVYTDAGGIFKRSRTLSLRDKGGSIRKRANWLKFNVKRNVATSYSGTTSETNPTLELRWKDDNKPWSDFRRFSLGERGELAYYAKFNKLGIYRTRQYEFQMSDPAESAIVGIETDEEVLTS